MANSSSITPILKCSRLTQYASCVQRIIWTARKMYTTVPCVCVCRSAVSGGCPSAGPLQTQTPASEVGDAGEAGKDAAGGAGAREAAGSG